MAKSGKSSPRQSRRKRVEPDAESKAEVMGYVLRKLGRVMWLVCTSQVVAAKHRQLLEPHYRELRQWVDNYPWTGLDETLPELLNCLPKNAGFLRWDWAKRRDAWRRQAGWGMTLEASTQSFSQQYLGRPWPSPRRPPSPDPILDVADKAVELAGKACRAGDSARRVEQLTSKEPPDAMKQMADALASYAEYHLDCPLDEWVPGKAIEAFGVVSFRPPEPIEEPLKESAWNDSLVEAERDREVRRILAAGILRRASTVLIASLKHCGVIRDGEQGPEVDAQLTNRRSEALRTMYRLFGSPEVADRPISLSIEEAKRYADTFDEWRAAWPEPPDPAEEFRPLVKPAEPITKRPADKSPGRLSAEGEWSAPMSLPEIARRITGKHFARGREIRSLLEEFGLEKVSSHLYRVRLDTMDRYTRSKLEAPPS